MYTREVHADSQQRQDVNTVLIQCWYIVFDAGPAVSQY